MERAIIYGFGALQFPGNGTWWFLQQLIAVVCYGILWPFNNIALLPQLISIVVKASAALSVLYFTSDRFEWVMKGTLERFITCIFVILLLPNNATDVVTVDTSLPFVLFFAAFLIGLDLLLAKEAKMPTIPQTIFLVALSASSAASVFIAAFCGLAALRWLIARIKEKNFRWGDFFSQLAKLLAISAGTLLQVWIIFSMGRGTAEPGNLFERGKIIARNFPFFPYSDRVLPNSIWTFVIGTILILVIAKLLRLSFKPILYCIIFSYAMMYFSSMSAPIENGMINLQSRFFILSYQAAVLLSFVVLVGMYRSGALGKYLSVLLVAALSITALRTYDVGVLYANTAYYFEEYSDLFDRNGTERLRIPTGPFDPWRALVPTSAGDLPVAEIVSEIEVIDLISTQIAEMPAMAWTLSMQLPGGGWPKRLLLHYGDMYYPARNNGDSFSILTDQIVEEEYEVGVLAESEDGVWYKTSILFSKEWQVAEFQIMDYLEGET